MSKVSLPVNGDFTEGMTLRTREYDWEKVGKMFSCDVDHMYASVDSQNKDREIKELKKTLLVNLDHIQTQAETIINKDKEIGALKKEIEMLRLRIQRMERRVTLQRHKDEIPATFESPMSPSPLTTSPASPVPTPLPISSSSSLSTPIEVPAITRRRRSSGVGSFRKSRASMCSGSKRRRTMSDDNSSSDRRSRSRPGLTSDETYCSVVGAPTWSPVDLIAQPDPEEEVVQVPSWREKVFTPLYTIEGTENVEDEVFLKRHHKLESDERRRKRWDIQRIREQTQVERLKQRVEKKVRVSQIPEIVHSFFPAVEDLEEIAVSPSLPVVAFGLPLRSFENCEFSLPWMNQGGAKYLSMKNS